MFRAVTDDSPPPTPAAPKLEDGALPHPVSPIAKLAIEGGPLAVFFIANAKVGIIPATAWFMGAVLIALVAGWRLERRLPPMAIVSAVVVGVFGGLTLWLDDELFIKLKPTIVNSLFAAVLLGGLAMGKALLRPLLGSVLPLRDEGWRKLTLRWALFFIFLAIVNEVVRRVLSTDGWVTFKVFGNIPLTIVFVLSQTRLIEQYAIDEDADADPPSGEAA